MKRASIFFFSLLMAVAAYPQQQAPARGMEGRVLHVHHQDPQEIANAVALLGSEGGGARLAINSGLGTITVRDFPENIALIEAAIRRLDVPSPASPPIRLQLYVLVGSSEPTADTDLPSELLDVVAELKTALRYSSYSLMTSTLHQTRAGRGVEGSGVADAGMGNFRTRHGSPLIYSYSLREIGLLTRNERVAVDVRSFRFRIQGVLAEGEGVQPIDVGFETPISIREGERVVVGTTALGNKALVVVVTAKLDEQE